MILKYFCILTGASNMTTPSYLTSLLLFLFTMRLVNLLRKQKSHPAWTQEAYRPPARCVASTPSAVLSVGWGGVPIPNCERHTLSCGTPSPNLAGGTPSWPGWGYPILGYPLGLGYTPERTWDQWKYYSMEMEYPWKRAWDQCNYYGVEMGYPPV